MNKNLVKLVLHFNVFWEPSSLVPPKKNQSSSNWNFFEIIDYLLKFFVFLHTTSHFLVYKSVFLPKKMVTPGAIYPLPENCHPYAPSAGRSPRTPGQEMLL